ncbi:hypothetical protein CEXT_608161 [Caerostris extrusa]|uniref:Uncharacterized protein n=1 Tax=Caerostris extrusa TaxID=172846 RepID=A0AAV4QH80_CAEEX|nr:hypothetical protein CEXT_608161 [Caerostris extrusa]
MAWTGMVEHEWRDMNGMAMNGGAGVAGHKCHGQEWHGHEWRGMNDRGMNGVAGVAGHKCHGQEWHGHEWWDYGMMTLFLTLSCNIFTYLKLSIANSMPTLSNARNQTINPPSPPPYLCSVNSQYIFCNILRPL